MNLPSNHKAEQAVLGLLLRSDQAFWQVDNILRADHFVSQFHRDIFGVIHDICHAGQKLSLTLVSSRLPEEDSDGKSITPYLAVLIKNSEELGSPLDFVEDITDAWARRAVIKMADDALKAARDQGKATPDTIADLETRILDISRKSEIKSEESVGTISVRVIDKSAKAFKDEFIPGFDTGLPSLDEILGRIMPGDMGVLGAGVGEAKTSVATQILVRASEMGKPVLMIQQEMPAEDIVRRILAAKTGMSVTTIEEGAFDFDQFDRLMDAKKEIEKMGLYIHAQPQMRFGQIRARCVSMKRSRGLGMVVIDSLKRTRADGKVRDQFEAIDYVTGSMKALALELDVPVILLSHRTRASQDRDDPRPRTTDFFGGGSIEENADWILGLWRRELWLQQRRPSKHDEKKVGDWEADLIKSRGIAEAICLKRRRGEPMKEARFKWNGKATRFEELDR